VGGKALHETGRKIKWRKKHNMKQVEKVGGKALHETGREIKWREKRNMKQVGK
jgi:hypothetical protein